MEMNFRQQTSKKSALVHQTSPVLPRINFAHVLSGDVVESREVDAEVVLKVFCILWRMWHLHSIKSSQKISRLASHEWTIARQILHSTYSASALFQAHRSTGSNDEATSSRYFAGSNFGIWWLCWAIQSFCFHHVNLLPWVEKKIYRGNLLVF